MIQGISAAHAKTWTVVGTIFNNLRGHWNFIREIQSKLASSPSGTVTGYAKFVKTQEGDHQYLYSEEGKFQIENAGTPLDVKREYLYEYDDKLDSIQVFFATNQSSKDRFFYTVSVEEAELTATGEHLCEADHYTARYCFPEQASNRFNIQFTVKGPQKDYVASTTFTRDASSLPLR